MNVEIDGNMCVANGHNWKYKQLGGLKFFTQTGKVPSLRVVKTLIKLIASIELEPVKRAITHPYGGNGCLISGVGGAGGGGPAGGALNLSSSGGSGFTAPLHINCK